MAPSSAEPPRLTRRPNGASARRAASATHPKTGSTTTWAVPPSASWRAAASANGSRSAGSSTTASAPARRARSTEAPARQAATTRCRPARLRHADRGLADGSSRAEDDDALAGLEPGPQHQRRPRRDTREADRGDRRVGHVGVELDHVASRHRAQLGQRAVDGGHPGLGADPDARPRRQAGTRLHAADALHTGHVGQCGRSEVRRARRAQLVERHDRRRGHPDDDQVGAAVRRGMVGVRRRLTVHADDGGSHEGSHDSTSDGST